MTELIANVLGYTVAIVLVVLAILIAPGFVNWLLDCFGWVLFTFFFIGWLPAMLLAAIIATLKN